MVRLYTMRFFRLLTYTVSLFLLSPSIGSAFVPTPDHVVILVLENHGYSQVVGSSAAPYINSLISDPYSALFTQSFALSHPSQPNYIQLFSGSNQGVVDDNVPGVLPFTTPNLGAELLSASKTFIGYSEDLPSVGYTGATSGSYARKHNPWVNWQGTSANGIPSTLNQPFTSFPIDYTLLPKVSFVIPNQDNDMHNGTDPATITTCDTWINTKLNGYIQWAKTHNSLLILTFDENDNSAGNQILTLIIGSGVQHGSYSSAISHYNVLRTLEDMYGLTHAGAAVTSTTIDYCWSACYQTLPTTSPAGSVSICSGNSVTLTASNGASFLWSNGATTQSIVVTTAGNYYVTIRAANGCAAVTQPVLVTVLSTPSSGIVFIETMGTAPSTTTIAAHETANGFDNDGYTMSGSGDLRNTSPSTGYTGASGLANVFLTNTAGKNFIISGINTTGLSSLQLSFGISKSTTTSTGSELSVLVSSDGTNYTPLTMSALPTGTGTTSWMSTTVSGTIPATANLRIQFVNSGATTTQFRIDDVKLQYASVPTITASGPTAFCPGDSVTLTASAGSNYLWSTGASTQSIKVYAAGNYSVLVNCISSSPITITLTTCSITLNLKVFFEGFYLKSDSMTAVADPFTYPKTFDTITVEVHDTTSSYTLLKSVRDTISIRGIGKFDFPLSYLGHRYYLVILHRNSMETWSKYPILFDSTYMNYDFTKRDTTVVNNPAPILNSISPSSATAGASAFTLTLNGSNFISGSIVKWNGSSISTAFVNSTQLTASVPSGNISVQGTANVTVFNPIPGGGTSASKTFTINPAAVVPKKFLFDAKKAETASNADWVIDEDNGTPQRVPTPAQSGIVSGTTEDFWTGALSSWGIALVKSGNVVETLPSTGTISYGNSSNAQDLSNYDVYVVDEPNIVYTSAEKTAILNFVSNGGGLLMISDHTISDRNNDGWDSPEIWNDLMTNNTIQNNPFGFSIDLTNISEISTNIRANSSTNHILNGTQGSVTQMEFNNGATITISTAANPNVQGLIWQSGFSQNSTHIMCASSTYGTGRIFVVTDSSPMDDGTGVGSALFADWVKHSHAKLFMNASLWLAKLQ